MSRARGGERSRRAGHSEVEPFEIAVADETLDDLRERLRRSRFPEQPDELGWDYGFDFYYLRELCRHWADEYDWRAGGARTERPLELAMAGDALHLGTGGGRLRRLPICLIHGWPGAPLEFLELIPLLVARGHDVVVPSLPGFGFSDVPARPLDTSEIAEQLELLMSEALGYERYAVQGGDWGSLIAARMAWDEPERVAALHTNGPGVLPVPGSLDDPPLSAEEQRWLGEVQKWRTRDGYHLIVQSAAPDALSPALHDSPVGLAAWLVDKYRRWSDCDGELERRFSNDEVCDFLTLYWATGTIASSLRLYAAEARDRWRLGSGERIAVPSAVAFFPAEIVRPPRSWTERQLADLRRYTEMPRGGHFAAFEEPELLADDVLAFLGEL